MVSLAQVAVLAKRLEVFWNRKSAFADRNNVVYMEFYTIFDPSTTLHAMIVVPRENSKP